MTDSNVSPAGSESTQPATSSLKMQTKLAFGIGSTAGALSLYSYGALVILYCNQILGLEVWVAGLLNPAAYPMFSASMAIVVVVVVRIASSKRQPVGYEPTVDGAR